MVKNYQIHDNGGRPFRVEIDGMKVNVYKTEEGKDEKHLVEFSADEIFIGKKSPKGGYDGLKPKEAEGNSILLLVGSKYIYIGSEIYQFQPVKGDTIDTFYSDIGNSDVPYPYAIGKTHMYIMLDKVTVEKSFFDMKKPIYQQYYEASTFLPMCLKGYQDTSICKDKKAARDRIAELEDKSKKLKVKTLQKRLY
jgi:hypothetical protein